VEVDDRKVPRPRSTEKPGIGQQRYALLKAAFTHAQAALLEGYPLEAIAVLESLITDRLGSMVHGSLGADVRLGHSLGALIKVAQANVIAPAVVDGSIDQTTSTQKAAFPNDILVFVSTAMTRWWRRRSEAIHAMPKVRLTDMRSFQARHDALIAVAVEGIRILLALDAFDRRERQRNGAGAAATVPDALDLSAAFRERLPTV
jgi:hypothetical protein